MTSYHRILILFSSHSHIKNGETGIQLRKEVRSFVKLCCRPTSRSQFFRHRGLNNDSQTSSRSANCSAEMQDAGASKTASAAAPAELATASTRPQTLEQWDKAISLRLYKHVGSHLPRPGFMLLEHSGSGAIWLPLVPLIWLAPQLSVPVSFSPGQAK